MSGKLGQLGKLWYLILFVDLLDEEMPRTLMKHTARPSVVISPEKISS